MSVEDGDLCCRVPACGRAVVGYMQIGSRGHREVYVGYPVGLNHFPLCAEHLPTAGAASEARTQQRRRAS